MQIRTFLAAAITACFAIVPVRSQEAATVADAARQSRQQKQQADSAAQPKSTDSSDATDPEAKPQTAKPSRVITNEDLPDRDAPDSRPRPQTGHAPVRAVLVAGPKQSAEYWKSQILPLKNSIVAQQKNIERLHNAIYFNNGAADTDQIWTERQRQKLEQLENMKATLKNLQDRLEQMQEAARRQGYGNSVYDP